jgi:hypothetical protein
VALQSRLQAALVFYALATLDHNATSARRSENTRAILA